MTLFHLFFFFLNMHLSGISESRCIKTECKKMDIAVLDTTHAAVVDQIGLTFDLILPTK